VLLACCNIFLSLKLFNWQYFQGKLWLVLSTINFKEFTSFSSLVLLIKAPAHLRFSYDMFVGKVDLLVFGHSP
jgi:hypothetical protein